MLKGNANTPGDEFETDSEGFVNFGEVSRGILSRQAQYGSQFIHGSIEGYPNLGQGLRFKGDPYDYHNVRIHKDDIEEFARRYSAFIMSK